MKKNRILAGVVLTAGLGLTGVVTASASGAATAASTAAPTSASARGAAQGGTTAAPAPGHGKGRGPVFFCILQKDVPPGKPGRGKAPAKTTVKIVNGKVYINGKPAPKGTGSSTDCPKPPDLPGVPGTEGGVVVKGAPGGVPGGAPVLSGVPGGAPGLVSGGLSDSGPTTGSLRG